MLLSVTGARAMTCASIVIGILSQLAMAGEQGGKYEVLEATDASQRFERILLNRAMFKDHLCTTYLARLREVVADISALKGKV